MFLATANLFVMIIDYSVLASRVAEAEDYDFSYDTPGTSHTLRLYWTDYILIIATVLLFFAYAHSQYAKRRIHHIARCLYVFTLAFLLIFVAAKYIHDQINFAATFIAPGSPLVYRPFTCFGSETASCLCILSNIFIALLTGVFSFVEVFWTFWFKPIEAKLGY
jgi:hypothetical protein